MIRLFKMTGSKFWFADLRSVGLGRVSTKRTNRREAEKVADQMRREVLDRAQLGHKEEMTVKEALDRYIGELEGSYRRDREWERDKLLGLGRWEDREVHQWDPHMLMSEITISLLAELQDKRRQEGLSNSRINSEVKMIQRTYNLCQGVWDVAVHPGVKFRTLKTRTKKRRLYDDEEARLLAELDPSRKVKGVPVGQTTPRRQQMQDVYDLVLLLIDVGCRTGEGTGIRWSQVSLQEGLIQFHRPKVDNEGLVGMTPRVKAMLMRRRSMYPGASYVFPRWDYQKVNPRRPRSGAHSMRAVSRAIERAGLNDDERIVEAYGKFTPHSFRDTFCSRLIGRGMSTAAARKLLGHATETMTSKYTHLDSRDLAQKAAELLA